MSKYRLVMTETSTYVAEIEAAGWAEAQALADDPDVDAKVKFKSRYGAQGPDVDIQVELIKGQD